MINQLVSQGDWPEIACFPQLAAYYIIRASSIISYSNSFVLSPRSSLKFEKELSAFTDVSSSCMNIIRPLSVQNLRSACIAISTAFYRQLTVPLLSSHFFPGFCNFNIHNKISSEFLLSSYLFSAVPHLLQQTGNHAVLFRSLLVSW